MVASSLDTVDDDLTIPINDALWLWWPCTRSWARETENELDVYCRTTHEEMLTIGWYTNFSVIG
jgi:hypothetical protein